MEVVKFVTADLKQKEFVIVLRKKVNAYFKENNISTKGNMNMYIKTLTMLSIYLVPFILLITIPLNIWLAFLMVILIGVGEAGVGMSVMHDGAHGAFSKKAWLNNIIAYTMYILGSNLFNWRIQHNIMHHTFTNIYGFDGDIDTKAALRLCDHAPLKKINKWQHIYCFLFYGLMTLSKFFTDINQLMSYNKSGITRKQNRNPKIELVKLLISKVLYLSIILGLPFILTDYKWWQILIGFTVLHVIAGTIMSTIFQMAHVVEGAKQPLPDKNGIIPNEWMIHQLNTTSDFAPNNRFLNWYVGGLNFQIEHHLFPNTCHIHYNKIAPIVEQTAKEFGFAYNLKPDFFSALKSHLKRLKSLGAGVGKSKYSGENSL